MKKIAIFVQFLCALVLLSSCEDKFEGYVVEATAPVVMSQLAISDIVLDPVNGNNPAVTFGWTSANYKQQTVVNYKLELSADATFTKPVVAGSVNSSNAIALSVSELNTFVGNTGVPPFAWSTIYARIVSTIGTQSSLPVASNSIKFKVYPYFNYPYTDYYLVGNATQPGWDNNKDNPPMFRSDSNPNEYNYVGYFGKGQFKLLEIKGNWQPQWGTNNGSTIDVNPGGGADPGTFPINNNDLATAGYYKFTINFSTKTFKFTPYTEAGSATFTSMKVEGTALTSTALEQSSFDKHIWFSKKVRLKPGDLKFVTNTNASWAAKTAFSGTATLNGGPIPVVVEDDYTIWFNDLTGHYIMIPLNL